MQIKGERKTKNDKKNMKNFLKIFSFIICILTMNTVYAYHRHLTVSNGLPTGEVQQIVSLPNKQLLVNCEGIFCLYDGQAFRTIPCDRQKCYKLSSFATRYHYLWQGDSLLWLRDLYQIYLFDMRTRSFRYDISNRINSCLKYMNADKHSASAFSPKEKVFFSQLKAFCSGELNPSNLPPHLKQIKDSLGIEGNITCATTDWQKGTWIGTAMNGIIYLPAKTNQVRTIEGWNEPIYLAQCLIEKNGVIWDYHGNQGVSRNDHGKFTYYNKENVKGMLEDKVYFMNQLSNGHFLMCYALNHIGYFYPEMHLFIPLKARFPQLNAYRNIVGACQLCEDHFIVYSQNGAFLLNTKTNKIASFSLASQIEQYSNKYNNIIKDKGGNLWIGTQNGLFLIKKQKEKSKGTSWGNIGNKAIRVNSLNNNCIRSLVEDSKGNIWIGTSCGISVVKSAKNGKMLGEKLQVINYGQEDGIPEAQMKDRSAYLLPNGQLAFTYLPTTTITFRPEQLSTSVEKTLSVVITSMNVNDLPVSLKDIDESTEKNHSSLVFAYDANNISFTFSALNYASPSHTQYRYRLLPSESCWSTILRGEKGCASISFRTLPIGKYTLEIQACIDGEKWGKSTKLSFEILPPFWLTWWAKLLYAFLLALVFYWATNLYLKKKKLKMEKENDQKVNRLFELREEARHQFAENTHIEPQKISSNNEEKILLEKMLSAIELHIADPDYGVNQLAQDICMSRSAIYAKLRNMLGISPADFIRNVRLKQAAQLLAETDIPIGEVAYKVGYSTHKAFVSNFKKMFNVLPSEYRSHIEPKENAKQVAR